MDQKTSQIKIDPSATNIPVFLKDTYTKNQAIRRLRLLTDVLNYKFFDQGNPEDLKSLLVKFKENFLKNSVNPRNFEADFDFLTTLGEGFLKVYLPSHVNLQLKTLESGIDKTRTIIMYVPFELPEGENIKLGLWFKQNFGPTTLYDLIFDPTLIGGCALSSNGVFKDYSLKQKIAEQRSRILEVLSTLKKQ